MRNIDSWVTSRRQVLLTVDFRAIGGRFSCKQASKLKGEGCFLNHVVIRCLEDDTHRVKKQYSSHSIVSRSSISQVFFVEESLSNSMEAELLSNINENESASRSKLTLKDFPKGSCHTAHVPSYRLLSPLTFSFRSRVGRNLGYGWLFQHQTTKERKINDKINVKG